MNKKRKSWLLSSVEQLKKLFSEDLQDHKKLQALENLNEVRRYKQYGLIRMVQESYRNGFLEKEEREFLDWTLSQHHIDYTLWSHRTRGLKAIMSEMKHSKPRTKPQVVQLPLFPDLEKKPGALMPIAMMGVMKKFKPRRVA